MIYTRDIIGDQWAIFVQAVAVGAVLGGCFDIFRAAWLFAPKKRWTIILRDALFCLWAGFLSFSFLLNVNFGMPRAYIYLGEGAGFLAWYMTLGKVNFWLAKRLSRIIKSVLKFIFRPFFKILKGFFALLKGSFQKIKIFCANFYANQEKRLKNKEKVLYNKLCLSRNTAFPFCGGKAGKEHGSFERSGTEKEKEYYSSDCSYCLRSVSSIFADSYSGEDKRDEIDS